MVNKTKKSNKRKYYTGLQKRKSRKMYGGDESEYNISPPPPPPKITSVPIPTPTLDDNIKDIKNVASDVGNVAVSAGVQGLHNVTNSAIEGLGLDPNVSVSDNVSALNSELNILNKEINDTEEGKELKKNVGELALDVVETLKPAVSKGIDIVTEGAQKMSKSVGKVIVTGMNEVLPPIFAINELANMTTAAAQAGETIAELTKTGAEAAEKLEKSKEKATSIWNSVNTMVNKAMQTGINTAKSGVDILKKNTINPQPSVQSAGGSLKKYNKTAKMIGGRITESQLEFLYPYVNKSQILQQYGGKMQTRRRHKRLTSRRC